MLILHSLVLSKRIIVEYSTFCIFNILFSGKLQDQSDFYGEYIFYGKQNRYVVYCYFREKLI